MFLLIRKLRYTFTIEAADVPLNESSECNFAIKYFFENRFQDALSLSLSLSLSASFCDLKQGTQKIY